MNYLEAISIPLNATAIASWHGHSVVIQYGVNALVEQVHLFNASPSIAFIYDINESLVRSDEFNLSIETLAHYEIKKPIPVRIECVDDNEFLAEVSEANIAMTGDSVGDALMMLKENIEAVFERYKSMERLGTEPSRQLQFLEMHIGAKRRK
jgi:hypothetical protein